MTDTRMYFTLLTEEFQLIQLKVALRRVNNFGPDRTDGHNGSTGTRGINLEAPETLYIVSQSVAV